MIKLKLMLYRIFIVVHRRNQYAVSKNQVPNALGKINQYLSRTRFDRRQRVL